MIPSIRCGVVWVALAIARFKTPDGIYSLLKQMGSRNKFLYFYFPNVLQYFDVGRGVFDKNIF